MFILLAAMLWFVAAPVVTYFLCVLVVLLASACFEWQIVRPIEKCRPSGTEGGDRRA